MEFASYAKGYDCIFRSLPSLADVVEVQFRRVGGDDEGRGEEGGWRSVVTTLSEEERKLIKPPERPRVPF